MLILNLVSLEESEIKYQYSYYPDGQVSIDILTPLVNLKVPKVKIICSLSCTDDVFLLLSAVDILKRYGIIIHELQINYLMGARTDRLFSPQSSLSLHLVANMINSIGANAVSILEPHSQVSLDLINKSDAISIIQPDILMKDMDYLILPDKGAHTRYIPTFHKYRDEIYHFNKSREDNKIILSDPIGKSHIKLNKNILVVDDLCDGGGTFLAVADKLKKYEPANLVLFITHMVQLESIKKLSKVYDQLIFSNSYTDWETIESIDNIKVIKV